MEGSSTAAKESVEENIKEDPETLEIKKEENEEGWSDAQEEPEDTTA